MKELPDGCHNYQVTKIKVSPVKSDTTKKRKHIEVHLRHEDGTTYVKYFEHTPRKMDTPEKQEAEDMRARIAARTFASILKEVKFPGVFSLPKAKAAYGKTIGIKVESTENKTTKKTYANIREIVAGGYDEEGSPIEKQEKPAAKKTAKKKTAKKAAKKTAKTKPEPPEEDEEEEEWDEEEESEDYDEEESEDEESEDEDWEEEEDEEGEDEDDDPFS